MHPALETFLKDKDDSITICIENQFELDSDMLIQIIDGVSDDRLKVCLDIGHAHANSIMPVEIWIETLGNRTAYYHLHNNHQKYLLPKAQHQAYIYQLHQLTLIGFLHINSNANQ